MEFSNRELSTRYHCSRNIRRTARFWLHENKRQIAVCETFASGTTCTNSTIIDHKFILMQIKLKRFVNRLLSAQKGSFRVARHFCQQNINLYASNFLHIVTRPEKKRDSENLKLLLRGFIEMVLFEQSRAF